ncbi:hypothetical protein GQ42DRAFT_162310 [Ramicandelaber brevisporus]|nr:hypothetical protein GQ42DRAFT_162310 [Ramicandelaber brevisporus]
MSTAIETHTNGHHHYHGHSHHDHNLNDDNTIITNATNDDSSASVTGSNGTTPSSKSVSIGATTAAESSNGGGGGSGNGGGSRHPAKTILNLTPKFKHQQQYAASESPAPIDWATARLPPPPPPTAALSASLQHQHQQQLQSTTASASSLLSSKSFAKPHGRSKLGQASSVAQNVPSASHSRSTKAEDAVTLNEYRVLRRRLQNEQSTVAARAEQAQELANKLNQLRGDREWLLSSLSAISKLIGEAALAPPAVLDVDRDALSSTLMSYVPELPLTGADNTNGSAAASEQQQALEPIGTTRFDMPPPQPPQSVDFGSLVHTVDIFSRNLTANPAVTSAATYVPRTVGRTRQSAPGPAAPQLTRRQHPTSALSIVSNVAAGLTATTVFTPAPNPIQPQQQQQPPTLSSSSYQDAPITEQLTAQPANQSQHTFQSTDSNSSYLMTQQQQQQQPPTLQSPNILPSASAISDATTNTLPDLAAAGPPPAKRIKRSRGSQRGTRSVQPVKRNPDGTPVMPIKIGVMQVVSLGTIVFDRPDYHTERYIYPVGYSIQRYYWSMYTPGQQVIYTCTIEDGGSHPKFRLTPEDLPAGTAPIEWESSTGAWARVIKAVNTIKVSGTDSVSSVSGTDLFGFTHATIAKLIQDLPNADKCKNYQWQSFTEMDAKHMRNMKVSFTPLAERSAAGEAYSIPAGGSRLGKPAGSKSASKGMMISMPPSDAGTTGDEYEGTDADVDIDVDVDVDADAGYDYGDVDGDGDGDDDIGAP